MGSSLLMQWAIQPITCAKHCEKSTNPSEQKISASGTMEKTALAATSTDKNTLGATGKSASGAIHADASHVTKKSALGATKNTLAGAYSSTAQGETTTTNSQPGEPPTPPPRNGQGDHHGCARAEHLCKELAAHAQMIALFQTKSSLDNTRSDEQLGLV
jgi:hypothetical protein